MRALEHRTSRRSLSARRYLLSKSRYILSTVVVLGNNEAALRTSDDRVAHAIVPIKTRCPERRVSILLNPHLVAIFLARIPT